MPSKTPSQAGIYFSHYECLGHTSRIIAIAEVFKKRFPKGNLFFIQAGVRQPQAQISQWGRGYFLPGVLADRRHFRQTVTATGEDSSQRTTMCMNIITHQKPELFITEFFPLGHEESRYELIPALAQASKQNTQLWAVAGYPLLTGENHDWRDKILSLYQRIIIFSPSLEKKFIADSLPEAHRKKYLDFFKRHEKKIVFAGYLLPEQKVVKDEDASSPPISFPKGVYRVAVLRGAGAYYPKLIAQAIRASDLLGKEYYLTVVAGPSTTAQEWDFFNGLIRKKTIDNLALRRSISDYEGLIKNSDLCVSVASYHTSVMLMKHGKKAVIIPFEGNDKLSCYEQPARGRLLQEMMGAKVLSIRNLTAASMAVAIQGVAGERAPSVSFPKQWFSGAKVLDNALTGLFGR